MTFLPYGRQLVEQDDIDAVVDVLRSDYLTTGPVVPRFERTIADAVGGGEAVAVSSGTAALHAACFAAGVGAGDEVIVPAITFLATANCARFLGAEPVFADVDPDTGLMLPAEVDRLGTDRTRAVIPVDLNGAPADLSAIRASADTIGAMLVDDAAHGLGAEIEGRRLGSRDGAAAVTVLSFHPVKHVTTGEGGAVVTADPQVARRIRLFRNHGLERDASRFRDPSPGPWYYEQHLLGYNLRLTDLQAALGLSQLGKLERFLARRRHLAARYDALLAEVLGVAPVPPPSGDVRRAYHAYSVLIDFDAIGVTRADTMHRLRQRGIGSQVLYIPVPMQPYYRERGSDPADYPGACRYYQRVLSLPLFPGMADRDVDRVVDELHRVLAGRDQGATPS